MMMLEENLAQMRTHRNNIHRYRRLMRTKLTVLERQYIEKRLQEEQCAFEALQDLVFPVGLYRVGPPAAVGGTP